MNASRDKVLFICPVFFDFHNIIIKGLLDKGCQVDFVEDRPFRSSFIKASFRIFRKAMLPLVSLFLLKKLKKLKKSYHYVFVINGEGLSDKSLTYLKEKYQEAKFILYCWDSTDNKRYLLNHFKFYDSVYTFDLSDANKYQLNFQPLFSSANINNKDLIEYEKRPYDISFVGTVHSDRLNIISTLSKFSKIYALNFFTYCFVQGISIFFYRKLILFISGKSLKLRIKNLSLSAYKELLMQSKAMVEIHHPNQSGLTARALDTILTRTKLISTNMLLTSYDFYEPQNIFIFDRKKFNFEGLVSFLNTPFKPLNKKITDRYRLENWLDILLR